MGIKIFTTNPVKIIYEPILYFQKEHFKTKNNNEKRTNRVKYLFIHIPFKL